MAQGKVQKYAPSSSFLRQLIESPDLVRTVQALPNTAFAALVRKVGVEDAGEIVALATTEQIVTAFDEDLFINQRPGQREQFDSSRFVIWLEVLLEAGAEIAAKRIAELSEDFVIQAISQVVFIFDHDALLVRIGEGDRAALFADKALGNAFTEEIDGYLLVSRQHDGWDAVIGLIFALDRDHRVLLERILQRCAAINSQYIDDLDELTSVLTAEESLAEDVEAEREERRTKLGYVEPRAARSFLALARQPLMNASKGTATTIKRDPITLGHFREFKRSVAARASLSAPALARLEQNKNISRTQELLVQAGVLSAPMLTLSSRAADSNSDNDIDASADLPSELFMAALRLLKETHAECFEQRVEELAYLANVLVAGAQIENRRITPAEAAEATLATVAFGAQLELRNQRKMNRRATTAEFCQVLIANSADILFRQASSTLANPAFSYVAISPTAAAGFLRTWAEVAAARGRK